MVFAPARRSASALPSGSVSAERSIRLRDGTTIALRPIRDDDKDVLAGAMARLSPESRYRRFFGVHDQLSERELAYLTEVDHHDHEAIVGFDPSTGDAIGVARYVRTEDPARAEAAVAVVDDWHGRGVARALLEDLADRAREEGVERFIAMVQADNERAVSALSALGPTTRSRSSGVIELDIELAPEGLGSPLASALRAAAGGLYGTGPLGERIRQGARALWGRRRGAEG